MMPYKLYDILYIYIKISIISIILGHFA